MTPEPATSAANTKMIPIVPVSAPAAAAPPPTAAAGSVSNQPYRIRRAVVQRTVANFLPTAEPMIVPEQTCVVDNPNHMGGRENGCGRGCLGCEALRGEHFDDALAHRAHDPPAAGVGAEADRQARHQRGHHVFFF